MSRLSLARRAAPKKCRPAIRRMHYLADILRAKGELPSHRKVSVELECSYKTIMRDMEFMRDSLNYPIDYDEQLYKWVTSGPLPEPVL